MKRRLRLIAFFLLTLLLISTIVSSPADAALWDKRYVIKRDQGQDILCDPYIVQKNDWISKIFRQKGEISEQDFPTFLEIFMRLNPQIGDINRIYPGNLILIPLTIITKETLPTRPSESVIIPFASISDQLIKTILIRRGDSVSGLISQHFGDYGSIGYQEGLRQFQELNPQITDLNLIMVGQEIHLPLPPLSGLESASMTAPEPKPPEMAVSRPEIQMEEAVQDETEPVSSVDAQTSSPGTTNTLKKVASLLDAELYDQGSYYFPVETGEDWRLDLDLFPMMRLKDQTRILFIRPYVKISSELNIVKSHWKNVRIVKIPALPVSIYQLLDRIFAIVYKNHPGEKLVFQDGEVTVEIHAKWILKVEDIPGKPHQHICLAPVDQKNEPFPEAIFTYLAKYHVTYWEVRPDGQTTGTRARSDHYQTPRNTQKISTMDSKRFIRNLASILGGRVQENVEISFPYAGIQINAFSNMLSIDSEHACLVDFGNFAGDSISAIEASGMKVASVTTNFDAMRVLHNLFGKLSIAYMDNPTIAIRNHQDGQGVFFTYPGLMVYQADGQVLFSSAVISDEQTIFLENRGIQIVRIVL